MQVYLSCMIHTHDSLQILLLTFKFLFQERIDKDFKSTIFLILMQMTNDNINIVFKSSKPLLQTDFYKKLTQYRNCSIMMLFSNFRKNYQVKWRNPHNCKLKKVI